MSSILENAVYTVIEQSRLMKTFIQPQKLH